MPLENSSYQILTDISEHHRATAARLYDESFGQKLALAIPDATDRIELFEQHFDLKFAMAAVKDDKLVGLAGFSTTSGSLTRTINYSNLLENLGIVGGNRAALVLALYERKSAPGELLMDGISVSSLCRGEGIGTQLLSKLISYAAEHRYETIRLDVIDTNTGARKLYERMGFVATRTEKFEYLRGILGFGAATTMIHHIK